MCSTWTVCASASYTRCPGRTSVYLFAASLQNLAVPQDFYSPLSVPLERYCSPSIRCRWWGTGGFREQGQCFFIGLSFSIPTMVFHYFTIFPFLYFLSIGSYCGAGVFGLIGCTSLSLSLAMPTSYNNNNNNNDYNNNTLYSPTPFLYKLYCTLFMLYSLDSWHSHETSQTLHRKNKSTQTRETISSSLTN